MVATEAFVGRPVLRKEDPELITGEAQYIDNWTMPGMAWMALVRPPYVHATIEGIDTTEAAAMPGVVGVFTAADLELGGLPFVWPITEDIKIPVRYPLTGDKIRFAGDAVAVVVAESREQAIDAAELVSITATELPAVTDIEKAAADGAPLLHDELGTNVTVHWVHGGAGDLSVFETAPVIVSERYVQPRLIPNAIEPRGCLAYGVPAMNEWTLVSATQIPHIVKVTLSGVNGSEKNLRVIAPDVGGGFGSKLNVYAEEALALALAKRLGRPIKWIEVRSEAYLATIHGRDQIQEIELVATAEGKIRAVRARLTVGMGAYLQLVTAGTPLLGAWLYGGSYDIAAYDFECTGVFTNTTPTDAYRGAGRPEATYAIERAVDTLARKLGKDPVELRRLNFIREFPATIPSGLTIDSGDYDAHLDPALDILDYD